LYLKVYLNKYGCRKLLRSLEAHITLSILIALRLLILCLTCNTLSSKYYMHPIIRVC